MARMCICSVRWRDANPQLIISLSSVLESSGYRLRFSTVSPDFIFNHAGISVAFIVALSKDQISTPGAWERVAKMESNFQRSYFLTSVILDQSFIYSYFKCRNRPWKPLLYPIVNWDMGLAVMLKLVSIHAERKREDPDTVSPAVIEQHEFVNSTDAVTQALSAIPGLEVHDAHSLMYGIGSIEAISRASAGTILDFTDLSTEKAQAVEQFFGNEIYNRTPALE